MTIKLPHATFAVLDALEESAAENLVQMAVDIGQNPETFFEDEDWSDIDLTTSDVTGVSFRGATLDRVKLYADQWEAISMTKPKSSVGLQLIQRPIKEHSDSFVVSDEVAQKLKELPRRDRRIISRLLKTLNSRSVFSALQIPRTPYTERAFNSGQLWIHYLNSCALVLRKMDGTVVAQRIVMGSQDMGVEPAQGSQAFRTEIKSTHKDVANSAKFPRKALK